jgi:glucokinase
MVTIPIRDAERRPMLVLCIDFGGTAIKLGLLDGSRIRAARAISTTGSPLDLTNVRRAVDDMLRGLSLSPAGEEVRVEAVGIAVPGIVNQQRGSLVAAHEKYVFAIDMDLRAWAEEQFEAPVVVENDARAALLGEVRYGQAVGESDAVLIILGSGIGTAALIDGRLLRGIHDHGGILGGHVTVELDAPKCRCGNVGCAEAVASTWTLERAVREHLLLSTSPWWRERLDRGGVELKDLLDSHSDVVSRDILDRFLRAWGAAIVGLCHAYDPNLVIVSGGVMRSADVILPALMMYVDGHLWSSSHRPRFVTSAVPEHSVLIGLSAACNDDAEYRAVQDKSMRERRSA